MTDHQSAPTGPRGARWFIAATYVFMAVVLAAWAEGWGEGGTKTAASPPPPAHHGSVHAASGTTGAGQ